MQNDFFNIFDSEFIKNIKLLSKKYQIYNLLLNYNDRDLITNNYGIKFTREINKINKIDEIVETDETNKIDEIVETDETNKIDKTDETNKIVETDETNKIDKTDETNEIDEIDETNKIDEIKKFDKEEFILEIKMIYKYIEFFTEQILKSTLFIIMYCILTINYDYIEKHLHKYIIIILMIQIIKLF